MALLQVRELARSFGGVRAVKGVSFDLREGRTAALLGPNGAGKTTLLRMLAGLLRPDGGSVRLAGLPEGSDLRSAIGYLPQVPAFYPWMTGREFLRLAGRLSGLTRRDAALRAAELLDAVGLREAGDRRIGGYSGGMKQRLGLAQAFMHRPRLLILDEPVSALDPIGRREVMALLGEWKRETTILFSTHVLSDAEEMTDDLLILREGEVVMAGELGEITERHRRPVIRLQAGRELLAYAGRFAALPAVEDVHVAGRQAEFAVADPEAGMASLVRFIAAEGIPVRKLESGELSLEDLFLQAVNGT